MFLYSSILSFLLRNEMELHLRSNFVFGGRQGGTIQLRIDSAWIGLNSKDALNVPHTHPGSHISGVFYVKTGGNDFQFEDPTQIIFFDPFNGDYAFTSTNYSKSWALSSSSSPLPLPPLISTSSEGITFHPKSGDILIFPSWARHFVPLHPLDSMRIVLAFNCHVEWNQDPMEELHVDVEI